MTVSGINLRRPRKSGLLPAVAMLCLALMALMAVAQVTHHHQNPSDADHCALCVTMHTVVPAAQMAAVVILVPLGFSAPVAKARSIERYWHPQLFIRPPPQSC